MWQGRAGVHSAGNTGAQQPMVHPLWAPSPCTGWGREEVWWGLLDTPAQCGWSASLAAPVPNQVT